MKRKMIKIILAFIISIFMIFGINASENNFLAQVAIAFIIAIFTVEFSPDLVEIMFTKFESYTNKKKTDKIENKKVIPFNKMWNEINRIAKENAAIIFFAQGSFYIDLVNSNRKYFRYDIIWNKVLSSGHLNAGRMPLRTHEQIAVFYRKLPTYNPQFTEGSPLHSVGKKADVTIRNGKENNNYGTFIHTDRRKGSTEKYPTSIISFQKPHPSLGLHPTAKPVELLEWLIKTYSMAFNLVPFIDIPFLL